jgi:hypothetical protein
MPTWFDKGFDDGNLNSARGEKLFRTLFSERVGDSPLSGLFRYSQVERHIAGGYDEEGMMVFNIVFAINDRMSECVVCLDTEDQRDADAYCFGLSIGLLHRASNVRRNHKLAQQAHDHLAYTR